MKSKIIIAKIISNIFNPFVLFAPIQFIYFLLSGGTDITILLVSVISQAILPFLIIMIFIKFKYIDDFEITNMKQRTVYFLILAILFSISSYFSSGNFPIFIINFSLTLAIAFIILINLKLKISGHIIFDTILIMGLSSYDIRLLWIILFIPFIAWSRVLLKKHTIIQTIGGFFLGMGIYLILSYLVLK